MSAPKHTPGPLSVLQNDKDKPTQFLVVAEGTDGRKIAVAKMAREADADLFIASHDLLESLSDALAFIVAYAAVYQHQHALAETHPEHQKVIDKCLASIAKAEGRS